jgi:F0F1-type ATP synthase assembly protein I
VAEDGLGFSDLLSLGLACGLTLAAGLLLGWLADDLLHTSPTFVLVGMALGIIGAGSDRSED